MSSLLYIEHHLLRNEISHASKGLILKSCIWSYLGCIFLISYKNINWATSVEYINTMVSLKHQCCCLKVSCLGVVFCQISDVLIQFIVPVKKSNQKNFNEEHNVSCLRGFQILLADRLFSESFSTFLVEKQNLNNTK